MEDFFLDFKEVILTETNYNTGLTMKEFSKVLGNSANTLYGYLNNPNLCSLQVTARMIQGLRELGYEIRIHRVPKKDEKVGRTND